MKKTYTNHNPIRLVDLIATQLEDSGHKVKVYNMDDGSGRGIEVRKRSGDTEFLISLDFDGDGYAVTGVSIFSGKIIETVEHDQLI